MILQLFIRPIKQNMLLEAVREIYSDYFTWIFPRGRQPSVNHFYFSHWQEALVAFLKMKLGVGSFFSVFLVQWSGGLLNGFHPASGLVEVLTVICLRIENIRNCSNVWIFFVSWWRSDRYLLFLVISIWISVWCLPLSIQFCNYPLAIVHCYYVGAEVPHIGYYVKALLFASVRSGLRNIRRRHLFWN